MSLTLTQIRASQIQNLTITDAQISATANIQLSKIQNSNLIVLSDGSVPFTAPVGGVAPTASAHLATKAYVDSVASGLAVKAAVSAIATSNITLSGTQTIDGVSLNVGDRVLVVGQTSAKDNGIYIVAAGAWSRSSDASTSAEVTSGMFTFVENGIQYAGSGWVLTTANPITLGTTALSFAQFSTAGVVQAGNGITKSGNVISITSANGAIVSSPSGISLTLADSTLAITSSGLKLAALSTGQILIGDATNTASAKTLSGDASLTAAGVLTIGSNAITNSKIASAAVTLDKITTLTPTKFIIGTSGGNSQVSISGDITVAETGVATINASTVVRVQDIVTRETPGGTIDGSNTQFTLANSPKFGTESVFYNGLLMDVGSTNDYTISGSIITFTFAPQVGDKVRVSYFK